MCIMYIKEHDQAFPSDETMKICWDDNHDGAGYSWYNRDTEMWHTVKGLMSWTAFLERFHKDRKEYDLDGRSVVVHFRVGTSGPEIGGATHPFPATMEEGLTVNTLEYISKGVFFHNGTIGQGKDGLSDTQVATTEYIQPMVRHIFEDDIVDEALLGILCELLRTNNNRYVITHGPNIRYLGDWVEDKESGLVFSNNRFKETNTRYAAQEERNKKQREYLSQLKAQHGTTTGANTKETLVYDVPERISDVNLFLDDDGYFDWLAWDNRYNNVNLFLDTKTNTTTDNTTTEMITVYNAEGEAVYTVSRNSADGEKWDENPTAADTTVTSIPDQRLITCRTCNLMSYPECLSQGECAGCGTLLDPEWSQRESITEDKNQRNYDCPCCEAELSIELTVADPTVTSRYWRRGLTDLCQCWKCGTAWGYTSQDKQWVIGDVTTDEEKVSHLVEYVTEAAYVMTQKRQANG